MKFTVIDNYLSPNTVRLINQEWPEEWQKKAVSTSRKWSSNKLGPAAQEVVDGIDIGMLERVTGISGLLPDPELFGAGYHCIPVGGFLNMHVDFSDHPTTGYSRRVNMLIYLNESWKSEWAGQLQIGIENPIMIDPIGGRAVIFETTGASWHGHPEPLKCPEGVQRRSLALYFYTKDAPINRHSTIYRH